MTRNSKNRLIVDRRRVIQAELSQHSLKIELLQRELEELDATERTLARLAALAGEAEEVPVVARPTTTTTATGAPPSTTKTEMSLRAMCETLLKDHALKGLTTLEMLGFIRDRWKPDVDPNHLRPLAWRMMKDGKWLKKDNKYFLVNVQIKEPPEDAQTALTGI